MVINGDDCDDETAVCGNDGGCFSCCDELEKERVEAAWSAEHEAVACVITVVCCKESDGQDDNSKDGVLGCKEEENAEFNEE